MYCNSCGHENPSAAVYCSKCGSRMASSGPRPAPLHSAIDRRRFRGLVLGCVGIGLVALGVFIFENVSCVPLRNDSMAPATIEVGAGETVLTLRPKEEQPLFFWLFHNHRRYFSTSITYPDGYRYNQRFESRWGYKFSLFHKGFRGTETLCIKSASNAEPFFSLDLSRPGGQRQSAASASRLRWTCR
jgi:hypothetical protein